QADGDGPWPELAQFDCYACHHNLVPRSWRQGRSKGRLVANSWNLSWPLQRMLDRDGEFAVALPRLRDALARPAGRAAVAKEARGLSDLFERRLSDLQRLPAGPGTDEVLAALRGGDGQLGGINWDDAAQLY